ncbi:hypothetical protein P3T36_006482 [Kitasatospora sp. MAP12-15]|uniref:hypothetical protein n=1 Tax=unclassified Kitasatospora TaxID=2633591 RepID=UPI002477284F|nr:hypothetical protein [Kitasatospora sp. MAP12-44]MDH6114972.1 hypothetical protein [Kitasatospora sp. MAP12-44]
MSNYVLTIPGTFKRPLTADAKQRLLAALHGVDPEEVGTVTPDLDVLTAEEGGVHFVLRLEVAAEDSGSAERLAMTVALTALAAAGYQEDAVFMGEPVVTGIDVR